TTITSTPRLRIGASASSAAAMPRASLRQGTMMESIDEGKAPISGAHPGVIALEPSEHVWRRMTALPCAGGVFVRFGEGRIDVYRTEYLVQPEAVAHREYELDDQIARMRPGDRCTEYP